MGAVRAHGLQLRRAQRGQHPMPHGAGVAGLAGRAMHPHPIGRAFKRSLFNSSWRIPLLRKTPVCHQIGLPSPPYPPRKPP